MAFRLSLQILFTILCCSFCHTKSIRESCDPSPTTVSGTLKPTGDICSGDLIFSDEFDEFNLAKWTHESTLSGGGNGEFQWYTNNRTNSYVRDGILYIMPTLVADQFGEGFLSSGTLDLSGSEPVGRCTDPSHSGCTRTGSKQNILNPIKSARVRSSDSFNFKYGKLEVRAKLSRGDWLWPAIWIVPRYNTYGTWPASGELDLAESRGNSDLAQNGKQVGSKLSAVTLHFGPERGHDGYRNAHFEQQNSEGYDKSFHFYAMEWKPEGMKFFYDDQLIGEVGSTDFWTLGNFEALGLANPWKGSKSKIAPFDQEFYIIFNLAVGGTSGFFSDGAVNGNGPKPWKNTSPTAMADFWNGRDSWLPTWNGEDAALQIDYVRVYAI